MAPFTQIMAKVDIGQGENEYGRALFTMLGHEAAQQINDVVVPQATKDILFGRSRPLDNWSCSSARVAQRLDPKWEGGIRDAQLLEKVNAHGQ